MNPVPARIAALIENCVNEAFHVMYERQAKDAVLNRPVEEAFLYLFEDGEWVIGDSRLASLFKVGVLCYAPVGDYADAEALAAALGETVADDVEDVPVTKLRFKVTRTTTEVGWCEFEMPTFQLNKLGRDRIAEMHSINLDQQTEDRGHFERDPQRPPVYDHCLEPDDKR